MRAKAMIQQIFHGLKKNCTPSLSTRRGVRHDGGVAASGHLLQHDHRLGLLLPLRLLHRHAAVGGLRQQLEQRAYVFAFKMTLHHPIFAAIQRPWKPFPSIYVR